MSIETHQHTFEVGDLVDTDEGERGVIETLCTGAATGFAFLKMEDGREMLWALCYTEPVVCEYCDSRKGCTCQEDIDAREAEWFHQKMDAAERDHWAEDKDRRADEEGLL